MKSLMFSILFFVSVLGSASIATALGTDGHGSDPMKNRFIIARQGAIKVLGSKAALTYFSQDQINKMIAKLTTPDSSADAKDCFERKLCWYNTDPTNPQPALNATLHGKPIEALLRTTPETSSLIEVDILSAKRLAISSRLATVIMVHEAGHAVGLSDDLITDERVLKLLEANPSLTSSIDSEDSNSPIVFNNWGTIINNGIININSNGNISKVVNKTVVAVTTNVPRPAKKPTATAKTKTPEKVPEKVIPPADPTPVRTLLSTSEKVNLLSVSLSGDDSVTIPWTDLHYGSDTDPNFSPSSLQKTEHSLARSDAPHTLLDHRYELAYFTEAKPDNFNSIDAINLEKNCRLWQLHNLRVAMDNLKKNFSWITDVVIKNEVFANYQNIAQFNGNNGHYMKGFGFNRYGVDPSLYMQGLAFAKSDMEQYSAEDIAKVVTIGPKAQPYIRLGNINYSERKYAGSTAHIILVMGSIMDLKDNWCSAMPVKDIELFLSTMNSSLENGGSDFVPAKQVAPVTAPDTRSADSSSGTSAATTQAAKNRPSAKPDFNWSSESVTQDLEGKLAYVTYVDDRTMVNGVPGFRVFLSPTQASYDPNTQKSIYIYVGQDASGSQNQIFELLNIAKNQEKPIVIHGIENHPLDNWHAYIMTSATIFKKEYSFTSFER